MSENMLASVTSVTFDVRLKECQPEYKIPVLFVKKTSPLYDKEDRTEGLHAYTCFKLDTDDVNKLIDKALGKLASVREHDTHNGGLQVTVDLEDPTKIWQVQNRLEAFVEKHFTNKPQREVKK